VWLGRADGTPVPGAFGADLALPVLAQAFGRLKAAPEPLRPPPADALIVATSELPAPLQRFRARTSRFDGPGIAFPPDGAEVEAEGGLLVRVQGGTAPFTWLADGRPVALQAIERETFLAVSGPGFVTLSVIDSAGNSARARVQLR
jgi:penicillin-binding protein 1C